MCEVLGWARQPPGQRVLGLGHFLCQRGVGGTALWPSLSTSSRGRPQEASARLGPSLLPPAWWGLRAQPHPWDVHRLARGFTQGQPATSQHATPGMRAAGPSGSGSPTVSFNRALTPASRGPFQVWDGERTGPPGAAGGAACGTVHSSALPCPPGVKACGGLPGVLPAADGRLRGPVPLRESPDAPGPRLPGPALLPSLCCSSISSILKA